MAMHVASAAVSGSAAAGSYLAAQAAAATHDAAFLTTSVIMAAASVGGLAVALLNYVKHRNDTSALEKHQDHDDSRFGHLEDMILGQATGKWIAPPEADEG